MYDQVRIDFQQGFEWRNVHNRSDIIREASPPSTTNIDRTHQRRFVVYSYLFTESFFVTNHFMLPQYPFLFTISFVFGTISTYNIIRHDHTKTKWTPIQNTNYQCYN
ncbi:hypothetical protein RF11_11597 [Thelohanellus kitauei]|uniref:Uncharacterized protein n=1 Tax=Thelohanellus kitauei TaxID=669202 RepID=A0A0C2MUC8_THEKT|nr:hypothetical protein RF11_11597 [Thelohanellus kitauei]